jgi:HlyD family secretion protein
MDRPLDPQYLTRQKRNRWLKIIAAGGGLIIAYLLIAAWIRPAISRSDIRTARVYSGKFEATLSASGTVIPEYEEVLISPGETRVISVMKKPGEHLKRGDQILQLDTSELALSLDRAEKDLTLKRNQRGQTALDMESALTDLRSQLHIKELRLNYAKSKVTQSDKMFAIGAISKDQLDQTKMDEQIATIDREDLEKNLHTQEASHATRLEGLDAEVATYRKECQEIRRELAMLSCRSAREGMLTWVLQELGAAVHKGDPIARIADLSGYRIDAVMSDVNAARIASGQPARVRINETYLDAFITAVYPAVENGVVKFALKLKDKTHRLLRSNLRVDVFVILGSAATSLLVEKGPFVTGEREQPIFVVRGDKAVNVTSRIGATSFDRVELASGPAEGDEIIISDMKDYHHLTEIRLR